MALQSSLTPTIQCAKCERLSISKWFGCLNSNGLNERLRTLDLTDMALVYFDVDNLKWANEKWGKPESSRRIAQAIKLRETDVVYGQYFSGDEFMAFVQKDQALGLVLRLRKNFAAVEMSATYVIVETLENFDIDVTGDQCDEFVTVMKSLKLKGCVGYL